MANDIDIKERIRRGHVTLALDTNATFKAGHAFLKLCDDINRVNRIKKLHLNLVVSSVVYMELLHDLMEKHGAGFRLQTAKRTLDHKHKINVVHFEKRHAEHTALFLARHYTTNEAWQVAKRRHYAHQLQLKAEQVDDIAGRKKLKCSATVDWLLIGQADCERWIVVTDDRRNEWELFSDKISLKEIIALLDDLLKN